MRYLHGFILAILLGIGDGNLAWGQLLQEISGDGSEHAIILNSSHIKNNSLHLYFLSRGNDSNSLHITLSGPVGVGASVDMAALRVSIEHTLANPRLWYPVRLNQPLRLASSPQNRSAQGHQKLHLRNSVANRCPWLTDQVYRQILAVYQQMGLHPSKDEICDWYTSSGPVSPNPNTPGQGSGGQSSYQSTAISNAQGVMIKNSCAAAQRVRYLVRVKIDLSAVDASLLKAGSQLTIRAKQQPYRGNRATLLKPVSEGRYSPSPIVIMASIGRYGNAPERMALWRWRGNKPVRMKGLQPGGYVYYRGGTYAMSVVSRVLVGGKGTFVLSNSQSAYAVCLNLVRRRQTLNRFPSVR